MDYLNLRADGRIDLDIKGGITTSNGEKIALAASGVAIRQGGVDGVLAAGERAAHDCERELLVGEPAAALGRRLG